MANNKKYDIGMGHMGGVPLVIWNRAQEVNGDYKKIAYVMKDGSIKYFEKNLPSKVRKQIEKAANRVKSDIILKKVVYGENIIREAIRKEIRNIINEVRYETSDRGGLSVKVFKQEPIKQYDSGFGWMNHELRTPARDKIVEKLLRNAGLDDWEIAAFLIHRGGRHIGDEFSYGDDNNVARWIPSMAKKVKAEINKVGRIAWLSS